MTAIPEHGALALQIHGFVRFHVGAIIVKVVEQPRGWVRVWRKDLKLRKYVNVYAGVLGVYL